MTTDEKVEKIQEIIKLKVLGVWESCHDDSGHRYRNTKTGHVQRSVTTKLAILSKPHLLAWGVKMGALWLMEGDRAQQLLNPNATEAMIQGMQMAHTDIRDNAGAIGNSAHSGIQRWINQGIADGYMSEDIIFFAPPNCDTRAIAAMRSVQKLFKEKNIIPIASEIIVGDILFSAGQLDFLCFWDGDLCLVDWKSSNQVSQEYILQVVGYLKFWESMTGIKIKKAKIAHISKDSDKYTIYKVPNFGKAWKAFKQICHVYDWKIDKSNALKKDIKIISI